MPNGNDPLSTIASMFSPIYNICFSFFFFSLVQLLLFAMKPCHFLYVNFIGCAAPRYIIFSAEMRYSICGPFHRKVFVSPIILIAALTFASGAYDLFDLFFFLACMLSVEAFCCLAFICHSIAARYRVYNVHFGENVLVRPSSSRFHRPKR